MYAISFLVFLTAQGAALIICPALEVHLGLLAGFLLGIVPFASWHLIVTMTHGFQRRDRMAWAAVIAIGKYAAIGLGLYALFHSGLLRGMSMIFGMLTVLPGLGLAAFFRSQPGEK